MDEKRAEYLVERYADLLIRIGYTWLGDRDDAQDICQTVLIKLLERPRTFPDFGQERAWVIRLAVNECKNWKKSAWFLHRAPLEEGANLTAELPEPGEGSLLEQVQALPPKYREVIFLRYYEGYAVKEIAGLLGIPVEIRDGRMWFVADGKELDITDLVDEDTPYIYTSTLANGYSSHVIVGGTPENYGYAECVLRLNGMPLGMSGMNYSRTEVLEEGLKEPVEYVAPGMGVYVVTGEKSATYYANWMLAAAEQLGFYEYLTF